MKLSGSKIVISCFLFCAIALRFFFDSYVSPDLPCKISLSYVKTFVLAGFLSSQTK
jgi:hypothetical protein